MKRIGFKVKLKEGYDKDGNLKSTKIDKNNGQIIRSRFTNSSKKKYNHLELFYKKSLINRVIDLEGWVFDAVGYSKEPENA